MGYALFTFSSLADYEEYRRKIVDDNDYQKAFTLAEETKCILSYERSFMSPVFE